MARRKSNSALFLHRRPQPYSRMSLNKGSRLEQATLTKSVCPYCAVGCGLNIYSKAGEVINIEGNPDSPINEGTLCPKGANLFQLVHNPHRVKQVLYRAPYSTKWETKSLDWALDRVANRIKQTRDKELNRGIFKSTSRADGKHSDPNTVRKIGTLGGAVLDNEENYLIKKLFGAGLGVVSIENQARI
jgi:formate dehydrogenase major subunit